MGGLLLERERAALSLLRSLELFRVLDAQRVDHLRLCVAQFFEMMAVVFFDLLDRGAKLLLRVAVAVGENFHVALTESRDVLLALLTPGNDLVGVGAPYLF